MQAIGRPTPSFGRRWCRKGRLHRGKRPPEVIAVSESAVENKGEPAQPRPHRISWARLLKRVFDIDMQRCPNCGACELKIIAAILEQPVIEKILTPLGLQTRALPRAPARGQVLQAA